MNIEEFRDYCLSLPQVTEGTPFGPDALVFKVGTKMFALCSLSSETFSFNIKNTPDKNKNLREKYPFITPGFHMNKVHWNTVLVEGLVSSKLIIELIDDSYNLVIEKNMTKKERVELGL